MKDFTITDADYVDFKKMLHKRKFTYDRQSEKMLKNLKEIVEFEGYSILRAADKISERSTGTTVMPDACNSFSLARTEMCIRDSCKAGRRRFRTARTARLRHRPPPLSPAPADSPAAAGHSPDSVEWRSPAGRHPAGAGYWPCLLYTSRCV